MLQAQERIAYRVEVIILRLVQSDFEPLLSPELRDFDDVLDLEKETLRRDALLEEWLNADPERVHDFEIVPPLTPVASQFTFLDGITHVSTMSEQMSGVWRNLRLSAEYRPEVYLAWEQAAEGDFPAFRVHNEEIIRIDDDHADQRFEMIFPEPEEPLPDPEFFHYELEAGVLELAPLPPPREHFVLDGEVTLRRSRFLHIDLDIEYRRPSPARTEGISGPLLPEHQGYLVQPLKQSRQVRTGRMEYFDAPVLGALVWVTGIDEVEEESDQ